MLLEIGRVQSKHLMRSNKQNMKMKAKLKVSITDRGIHTRVLHMVELAGKFTVLDHELAYIPNVAQGWV